MVGDNTDLGLNTKRLVGLLAFFADPSDESAHSFR